MRTEAQREASRINGAKSKGPKTAEGKDVSRFNGLKHGLRAEQVVLPGEDTAEYEAERQGWLDDWKPRSHTRAVLCERAAQASWRLRRAVRAEAARLAERAEDAGRVFDAEQGARVERAVGRFDDDPLAALTLLESDAAGVDRLIHAWTGLAEALAGGPGGWSDPTLHARLAALLGFRAGVDPITSDPTALASARLLKANDPVAAAEARVADVIPLPWPEASAVAERLRLRIEQALRDLAARRASLPDPSNLRDRAVASAMADTSAEAQLRHRYEMAHERSLRGAIQQLQALEASGADLAGSEGEAAQPEPASAPADASEPAAPGSPGAGPVERRRPSSSRGPRARRRRPDAVVGGRDGVKHSLS